MIILDWVKICDIICHKRDVTLPARNRELPTPIIRRMYKRTTLEVSHKSGAGPFYIRYCNYCTIYGFLLI